MSDNILPKIFEGFPELANQAESLEAALDVLSQKLDAHLAADAASSSDEEINRLKAHLADAEQAQNELRAQVAELEASQANIQQAIPTGFVEANDDSALKDEVAHWKEKYDALAGRFDAEVEAAKGSQADDTALAQKDAEIAELHHAKEQAGDEIARLAEAVALANQESEAAKAQLEAVNAQLTEVQSDLRDAPQSADIDALHSEIESLKSAAMAAEETIQELQAARRAAEERAATSEAARATASARLGSLIESLNAAQSAGAA